MGEVGPAEAQRKPRSPGLNKNVYNSYNASVQDIWAGRKPLSLEMFKQMTQEGSEHLDEGVERQEGDLYDHKDFFLPLGFMIQCELVSEKTNMVEEKWLKSVSFGSRIHKFKSQFCHPLTENCKIQSKGAHLFKACSVMIGTVGI